MIEQTISTLLSTAPAITALIDARAYPVVLPDDPTLPALCYSIIASSAKATFTTVGTQRFRIEVNCWGTTYSDAVTLRSAVISSLNGYSNGTTSVQYLMSQDFFDHELLQYRAMVEFYGYTSNF
jgi:hypothetical protein